jgi:plasmid stabilization system protein ParE
LSYTLHRAAERDLADAVRFDRQETGRAVAGRFLDEFERVAKLLTENPGLGTPTGEQRRWFPPHGFPYSVIYRPLDIGVRILVVRHQNRDPEHGELRR